MNLRASAGPSFTFQGQPISIEFRPGLRVMNGKLVSGGLRGQEVHAATYLRERRIVLDSGLIRKTGERNRILLHELAHFVWWRAASPTRREYEELIHRELDNHIPGEMGWSAEWRKLALDQMQIQRRTRRFREYLCESFCDTAAAHLNAISAHPEISLPRSAQRIRSKWLTELIASEPLRI